MKKLIASFGFALGLLLGSGCSSSESPAPSENAEVEIKGEPISDAPSLAEKAETNGPALSNSIALVATSAPPAQAHSEGQGSEEFAAMGFEKLASFTFKIPDDPASTNALAASSEDQIPVTIKALDLKKIALKGFMLPLKVENGLVTEMLIMRDQSMCCYGTVPKITEWVSVKMNEKGVKPMMDQPVTLFGTLHVGEMRENGYLVGIYRMDGDRMDSPVGF